MQGGGEPASKWDVVRNGLANVLALRPNTRGLTFGHVAHLPRNEQVTARAAVLR